MLASQIAADALDQVESANAAENFEAVSDALDAYHEAVGRFRAPTDDVDLRRWAALALRYERLTAPVGETGTENALAFAVLAALAGQATHA